MINIAFDLDGVLVNLIPRVDYYLKEMFHSSLIVGDSFRFSSDPPLSMTKIWKAINAAIYDYKNLKTFSGVEQLLDDIYIDTGMPIRIITARPIYTIEATYRSVKSFCNAPFEIVLSSPEDKWKHLMQTQVFVEDRRKTALQLASKGKIVFLVNRKYNQIKNPPAGVVRIDHLGEIYRYYGNDILRYKTTFQKVAI